MLRASYLLYIFFVRSKKLVNKTFKNSRNRYFALTLILIPFVVFIGEIFTFSLFYVKKRVAPSNFDKYENYTSHTKEYDLITGSHRYTATKKDLENKYGYINKHGLIKTIFSSNKDFQKDIKGILITGNSVAVGYPMHVIGRYKDSFINKLESEIREKDESVDIINLSYYGMNSWEENIELARYFNSESNHKDLPSDISLIASIGGVQDFWRFIDLLYISTEDMNNYSYANGMQKQKNFTLNYFKDTYKALTGNISSGLKIFIISITNNIRSKSNMYRLVKGVSVKGFFSKKNRINKSKDTFTDQNKLPQIIADKIGISPSEYYRRKDISVKSVTRNMKSMQSLNSKGKFLFVYLPTRFGFTPNQYNIDDRIKYNSKLNVSDLYFLEKDYKNSLIDHLSVEGIKVINISSTAEDNWFYDESHYSAIGHKKISSLISPIFLKLLERSN